MCGIAVTVSPCPGGTCPDPSNHPNAISLLTNLYIPGVDGKPDSGTQPFSENGKVSIPNIPITDHSVSKGTYLFAVDLVKYNGTAFDFSNHDDVSGSDYCCQCLVFRVNHADFSFFPIGFGK